MQIFFIKILVVLCFPFLCDSVKEINYMNKPIIKNYGVKLDVKLSYVENSDNIVSLYFKNPSSETYAIPMIYLRIIDKNHKVLINESIRIKNENGDIPRYLGLITDSFFPLSYKFENCIILKPDEVYEKSNISLYDCYDLNNFSYEYLRVWYKGELGKSNVLRIYKDGRVIDEGYVDV